MSFLVVGSPVKYRIKTSADHIAVSAFFRERLFGPYGKSILMRSPERPYGFCLEREEDPEAMLALCCIVHHKVDKLFEEGLLAEDGLYRVVKLAKAYGIVERLHLPLSALLEMHFEHSAVLSLPETVLRASAAYVAGDAKLFRRATRDIVRQSNDHSWETRKLDYDRSIPPAAFSAIADQRHNAQERIWICLESAPFCSDCGDPIDRERYDDALRVVFWSYPLASKAFSN